MSIQTTIEQKLTEALTPTYLQVINESHAHNVPPHSETHFKVVIVTEAFNGQRLLQRHQTINALLADELHNGVHALALHTYTPQEWTVRNEQAPSSPKCAGGH